ncbi:MAG: hypothetical protein AB7O65_06270, partial [Candidatus Korobacteraceae bacterium]
MCASFVIMRAGSLLSAGSEHSARSAATIPAVRSTPIRHREILERVPGPAPWYWNAYPEPTGASGRKYVWVHHGEEGPLGYLVTLAHRQDPNTPLLALNTYCRPFLVPHPGGSGDRVGIWCPEPGYLRVLCFDPDDLSAFSLTEIAGWFKQSNERVYSATGPLAELEISSRLTEGPHRIDVPSELHGIPELLLVSSHPARTREDAASAILILRPAEGCVDV